MKKIVSSARLNMHQLLGLTLSSGETPEESIKKTQPTNSASSTTSFEKTHEQIEPVNDRKELRRFLARIRDKYVSCELIRIGGDRDGGYLLPNNFNDISYCFSPGVDYVARFESELSKTYNIKSFMADASVDGSPIEDENLIFTPKFLGSRTEGQFITLSDWIEQSIGNDRKNRILQMDIEGAEYEVLTFETSETLSQFSMMVIEFHGLPRLFDGDFLGIWNAIMEKIYANFSICHIHPNNCCGTVTRDGIEIPRVAEFTFIRNDLIENNLSEHAIRLPHSLDRPNVQGKPDITMPEIWWKDA